MKIRIIILQVAFFILLLCLKPIFHTQSAINVERIFYTQGNAEIALEIVLLLGLSFCMCKYISKTKKMFQTSFGMSLSLCLLFEISKYIEYLIGFLPNYGDVPILISILLSYGVIFFYTCLLYFICLLWKKWRSS
jgi:hypothetical protein